MEVVKKNSLMKIGLEIEVKKKKLLNLNILLTNL